MPITKTYSLTPIERRAIEHYKPEELTVEDFLDANNIDQVKLDAYVKNYVTEGTLQYAPIAQALVIASEEQLAQVAPHIEAIKTILGLEVEDVAAS
jgi:hypothetical protein